MIPLIKIGPPYSILIFFLVGISGCMLPLEQQKLKANAGPVNTIVVESSSGPSEIALAKHLKKGSIPVMQKSDYERSPLR
jgi:hypothetical protein